MEYSRIKTSIYLILLSKRNIPIFMPFLITKDLSDYGTNRIAVSVTNGIENLFFYTTIKK